MEEKLEPKKHRNTKQKAQTNSNKNSHQSTLFQSINTIITPIMNNNSNNNKKWLKHEPAWYYSYYRFKVKQFFKHLNVVSLVKLLLFCLVGYVAYRIEFFIVYLIVSTVYLLYRYGLDHTSSSSNSSSNNGGIRSAYSVFNENCQTIPGTFTASDFDRSLRRGGTGL